MPKVSIVVPVYNMQKYLAACIKSLKAQTLSDIEIYRHVEERLENGWETTIKLLEQGIEEEVIRPVNVLMFKMMMEASIEQFFQRDILIRAGMTYTQGLDEIVGILLDGVAVKESH